MSRLKRVVHPQTTFAYGLLSQLAADIVARDESGATVPNALAFVDPDGETHLYILDDAGVARLRQMLSGLVIADNGGV